MKIRNLIPATTRVVAIPPGAQAGSNTTAQLPLVTRYVNYFSPEVRGQEHLPATGPGLVVGNHSNLFYMPDAWVVGLEIIRRRGLDQPAYRCSATTCSSASPWWARSSGASERSPPAGRRPSRDWPVVGSSSCTRVATGRRRCPWTERNRVDLGGHRGFVRLALRTGVPVVPVVTHGSHDAIVVVSRGERLARMLGLHRLRIQVFPIFLAPFGLTTVLTPPLPMPSSITVEFLPPLDWSAYGPESADDEEIVDASTPRSRGPCRRPSTGCTPGAPIPCSGA